MLIGPFFQRVNFNLRGTDDDAPTQGGDDYPYWIDTYNRIKDEVYGNVTQRWTEGWQVLSLGTIIAATIPTFDIDPTYLGMSDVAYIIDPDGKYHEYDITDPQSRDPRCRQVYIAGQNPKKLYFTNPIAANEVIIGGELFLPGYYLPADAVNDASVVLLPDSNWGAMKMAAELAFNDLTYEDKAPDLNAKAENMYRMMSNRNRMRGAKNPNRVKSRTRNRIRGFH